MANDDEKLYIVINEDGLGWGMRYNPDHAKFADQKEKRLQWAYYIHEVKDGLIYRKLWVWKNKSYDVVEAKHQPIIVDNTPQSGFKVSKFATRWSTSNKLWRITDPRGFELEISTQNLFDLMMETTIINGEFMCECVWDFGKNGIGKSHLKKV